MPPKRYLEAGQVVGTHGVCGELRVQPWCDSPAVLASLKTLYFDEGRTPVRVRSRPHKNVTLVKLEGVDTVQDAAALRGRVLYLDRQDLELPSGHYFIQDLIGLSVTDADTGKVYGSLKEVSPTGANDVYHVNTDRGEVLIPAIAEVIAEVDLEAGVMRIRPLKGLFDDEN
ncbi:MAG: 16S rRNA processing protein RimM [Clostridiales bacterium]|nr:16S rRNA processing protein RimM [Clostridiales bacterium]